MASPILPIESVGWICILAFVVLSNGDRASPKRVIDNHVQRVVFSLTTIRPRIHKVKPVLDAIMTKQTRKPDVIYLAVPPDVDQLPSWLSQYGNKTSFLETKPSVPVHVLRMARDYGPASKLLAALREGGERSDETIIIFGDDDMIYGNRLIELHVKAQTSAAGQRTAFGSRLIGIGTGADHESILEATGTISLRASWLPEAAFAVAEAPDDCRFSDDYWISHHLASAGIDLATLPSCVYDFGSGLWPSSCGEPFEPLPEIQHIAALSEMDGDWRGQLRRYERCQRVINANRKVSAF